jgi:hypothetical protein
MSTDSLEKALLGAMIYVPQGGSKRFIPRGELLAVVNDESVRWSLESSFPSLHAAEVSGLTAKICHGLRQNDKKSFKAILSILVLIRATDKIFAFLENDVDDSLLPLDLERQSESTSFLKSWSPPSLRMFLQEQWSFLAPVFDFMRSTPEHLLFTENHVLPMIGGSERLRDASFEDEPLEAPSPLSGG